MFPSRGSTTTLCAISSAMRHWRNLSGYGTRGLKIDLQKTKIVQALEMDKKRCISQVFETSATSFENPTNIETEQNKLCR